MPNVTLISTDELREMLIRRRGASLNSMVWATEPDLLAKTQDEAATPNPFRIGRGKEAVCTIIKVNKVNGITGGNYDRMVENRLAKAINAERDEQGLPPLSGEELDSEVDSRFRRGESWHRPVFVDGKATCIRVNKKDGDNGTPYVQFVFKAMGTPEYVGIADGETVPTDNVRPFTRPASNYQNQGLGEDSVRFVCPALSSILELAIDGERFRVSDNFQQYPAVTRRRLWAIAEEFAAGQRNMTAV